MAHIDSTFALLDVKKGRVKLANRAEVPGVRIPVFILGFITNVWGNDDGVSQEFEVEVTHAEEIGQ